MLFTHAYSKHATWATPTGDNESRHALEQISSEQTRALRLAADESNTRWCPHAQPSADESCVRMRTNQMSWMHVLTVACAYSAERSMQE
jgi:hypothetical protein